ncbi:helix-turn-helix transcriptional regulator [Protofrankia coriariae]|uniref:helix-turn-helix transcriptional regulator n=1 Tax=Protofrankia coriariae TaxID=1562887 RepID=UPI000A3278EE|nr:helix-turn-helix transcriptional regulator [Protofrankia coriariae]
MKHNADMDRRSELGAYLRSRRAQLRPQDVGLPGGLGHRRVPGLRREELALLAGVSVDYYIQLEQGRTGAISHVVLDAVARALRLDGSERDHLFHLARPAPARPHPPRAARGVRPALRQMLDSFGGSPAYIVGPHTEVLAWNPLACAVFADFPRLPPERRVKARLVYLDETWRDLYDDWEQKADDLVAYLRYQAGRDPDDPDLAALVGELSVKSEDFRRRWSRYVVRDKTHGTLRLNHPLVGPLDLSWETLRSTGEEHHVLIVYFAEPDSPSEGALRLLGSWQAEGKPPTGAGARGAAMNSAGSVATASSRPTDPRC